MAEFAEYYVNFLWAWLQNLWYFIKTFFYLFYKLFIGDAISYCQNLGRHVGAFDVWGWICLIIVSAANIAFLFFICYRLFQLVRRYIFFRAKEVDKDRLMEEVARLKEQADQLVKEKSKIFALKLGMNGYEAAGSASTGDEVALGDEEKQEANNRFTKLINLDEKYERNPNVVYMTDEDMLTLPQIVTRFVNFAASQLKLYYTEETIRVFLSGMATSKVLILEGISGTGKTSLPYAMGKFFNNGTSIISVQPSWRDRADLIGYFNEFTKKFNETDFLASLYEVSLREDPNFMVLDEMNLARIEYYFADFLSIMEMPDVAEWKIDLIASPREDDPKNVVYGKFLVPQNVWFIGTANNDDSTFTITDKVYDRAVTLELNNKADYFDAPLTESYNCSYSYLDSLFERAHNEYKISEETLGLIKEFDAHIRENFKISFGNRIMKQLKLFVPIYMACGGTELGGVDFIITSKILRKFNALNLPFLHKELSALIDFFNDKFGKDSMPYCVDYIKELQKLS
ncbi:MAG: hypothetical protein K2O44_06560 [Clostridia bacterium]|nr:hypothetical protein [Clostridia bacterium]